MKPLEHAIFHLCDAMRNSNRSQRCTNENALHYCQEILANIDILNKDLIDTIAIKTILHDKVALKMC